MDSKKNAAERKIIPIAPETAPPERPRLPRSIFRYAFILLGVAFLMVLLSFLSHMQKSNQQMVDLQESQNQISVSALQSLEKLQQENADFQGALAQLQAENEALLAQLAETDARRAETEAALAAQRDALAAAQTDAGQAAALAETQRAALDCLWRLERLVSLKRYTKARALLADMRDKGLDAHLPDEAPDGAEPDGLSPAGAFARLADVLD
ncbi:MAG: hypothetical protein LBT60_02050 [Oscillospiraceae bacterium]|jgi:septal ring factor EnvC (AmiA/AmiB activator)|nr:hypothetical protein [Oscillospiraceae bacterium]